jgi:outer membrane protein assembly factor BamA
MLLPHWSKSEMNAIGLLICASCATLLLAANAGAQDPPPNAKWKLTAIAFEGLKSQSPDKIGAVSGLQVGQTIDFEAVKAAAQRLSQTGLFGKVSYRGRGSQKIVGAVAGGEKNRGRGRFRTR